MTEFMQYAYVFLWAALAVLTFFIGRKQGALGYLMAVFFLFMTVWYALRAFGGLPVFEGVWGNIFRGVLIAFLAVIVVIWWRGRKNQSDEAAADHPDGCDCEACNRGGGNIRRR